MYYGSGPETEVFIGCQSQTSEYGSWFLPDRHLSRLGHPRVCSINNLLYRLSRHLNLSRAAGNIDAIISFLYLRSYNSTVASLHARKLCWIWHADTQQLSCAYYTQSCFKREWYSRFGSIRFVWLRRMHATCCIWEGVEEPHLNLFNMEHLLVDELGISYFCS